MMVAIPGASDADESFYRGADLTHLPLVESRGATFRDASGSREALDILQDHGLNFVRLRLYDDPPQGWGGLEQTVTMARRVKDRHLGLLLAIQFSDVPADPTRQAKPEAWCGLPFDRLKVAVFRHAHDTLAALRDADALPDVVQLGNGIDRGMLWPDGRVGGDHDTVEHWMRLAELIQAAQLGIQAAVREGSLPKTMIHLEAGGDEVACRWFADNLVAHEVSFDMVGVTYHPWWNGSVEGLERNLHELANRFATEVAVVETGYPWTLEWIDETRNHVGASSRLLTSFGATPAGQRAFVERIVRTIAGVPNGLGRGFFYLSPEWISTERFGSPWENVALFSQRGRVLPAVEAFATPVQR